MFFVRCRVLREPEVQGYCERHCVEYEMCHVVVRVHFVCDVACVVLCVHEVEYFTAAKPTRVG